MFMKGSVKIAIPMQSVHTSLAQQAMYMVNSFGAKHGQHISLGMAGPDLLNVQNVTPTGF